MEIRVVHEKGKFVVDVRGNVLEYGGIDLPPAEMPAVFDLITYQRQFSHLPAEIPFSQLGYSTETGVKKAPSAQPSPAQTILTPAFPAPATAQAPAVPPEQVGELLLAQMMVVFERSPLQQSMRENIINWMNMSHEEIMSALREKLGRVVNTHEVQQILEGIAEAVCDSMKA